MREISKNAGFPARLQDGRHLCKLSSSDSFTLMLIFPTSIDVSSYNYFLVFLVSIFNSNTKLGGDVCVLVCYENVLSLQLHVEGVQVHMIIGSRL